MYSGSSLPFFFILGCVFGVIGHIMWEDSNDDNDGHFAV
mgnify:CR=1 FL=1